MDADPADLQAAAIAARERAYAPYSDFQVGAALLSDDGRIFSGCNIENASFGLTQCAERVALCSAVAAGATRFARLALASSGGVLPCGACRQVLAEFCDDLLIVLIDITGQRIVREVRLSQIFPEGFKLPLEHDSAPA